MRRRALLIEEGGGRMGDEEGDGAVCGVGENSRGR